MERAAESLDLVGLPHPRERLEDYPHQLSGGQRQRVIIAIALSCDPKVLIADEPTTALDVTIQAQILGLLDDLKERLGMAVLLITHDMGVVAGRADRVDVMYAGRIVESAPTVELFTHMHHPYTQALLGSIPLLTQDRDQRLFSIPGIPPDLTVPPPGCRFAPRCSRATDQVPDRRAAPRARLPRPLFRLLAPRRRPPGPAGGGGRRERRRGRHSAEAPVASARHCRPRERCRRRRRGQRGSAEAGATTGS